jgi:hypothetical protein
MFFHRKYQAHSFIILIFVEFFCELIHRFQELGVLQLGYEMRNSKGLRAARATRRFHAAPDLVTLDTTHNVGVDVRVGDFH